MCSCPRYNTSVVQLLIGFVRNYQQPSTDVSGLDSLQSSSGTRQITLTSRYHIGKKLYHHYWRRSHWEETHSIAVITLSRNYITLTVIHHLGKKLYLSHWLRSYWEETMPISQMEITLGRNYITLTSRDHIGKKLYHSH